MTTVNRFAPPKALVEDIDADAPMWREGKLLVLRKDGVFPNRCIKCNAPSVAPKRRYKLSWHSPWLYLLLIPALLLYAIVASVMSKRATVEVGLCGQHQKRVLWGRIIGWGGLLVELALVAQIVTTEGSADLAICLALLWLLVWSIATVSIVRLVTPARIDDRHVHLRGCGKAFLASLPERF